MTAEAIDYRTDLIEKCKRGERSAQEKLYRDYADAMYNVAFRMVNDAMEAEDILITSFTDVFRAIDSYNYKATPGAWIKRIVINNAISRLRKKSVSFVYLDSTVELSDQGDISSDDLQIDVQKIKYAIAHLAEGYRAVLQLYLIEGYDHKEISDILNISVATSKSQYSRAKKRLRELLMNQNKEI